jgi:cytochrome c peroxidase
LQAFLAGIALLLPGILPQGLIGAQVPPLPAGVAQGAGIIKSTQWAIALGKALFWDQQAGSDGNACAGCHFNAGADTRLKNQLNPGFKDISKGPNGDSAFGSTRSDTGTVSPGFMPSGALAGSNYKLQPGDLPLHRLQDESNANSPIVTTTNDRISSQGAFGQTFVSILPLGLPDVCKNPDASIFNAGPYAARQVEPRNTPTTINAVFNNRQFWDGRAANMFNGVGPFGMRDVNGDPNKRLIVSNPDGTVSLTYLQLENGSLASQAVGPVVSSLEMSCSGRSFADVGRRLLLTLPLKAQVVDPTDSVLGPLAGQPRGLKPTYTYAYMIQQAFENKYWAAPGFYQIQNGAVKKTLLGGYTQMANNFSMFWGIAIMMYESTLISDQSEYDGLLASQALKVTGGICSAPNNNVDALLLRGCSMFFSKGCIKCHTANGVLGDRFSEAQIQPGTPFSVFLKPATDITNRRDLRDRGFANIGLRPPFTDLILGATDPYGNPLSYARQYKAFLNTANAGLLIDPELQAAITAKNSTANPVPTYDPNGVSGTFYKLEVDGASKIPTLRNVALTPPYFSWGGYPSLRQVLKVYNRGMNRRDITTAANPALEAPPGSSCTTGDNSGSGPEDANGNTSFPILSTDCATNTTGLIFPLGLSDCDANGVPNPACLAQGQDVTNDDLAAFVRFLKSLTDARVQCDQAPFDHPQLFVFTGQTPVDLNHDGMAQDILFNLPAVGAAGYPAGSQFCIPNAGDLFAPGMQGRSGGN